ncbi:MAG: hypothetical protein EON92_12570, partial [Burkholderiales bacterium]
MSGQAAWAGRAASAATVVKAATVTLTLALLGAASVAWPADSVESGIATVVAADEELSEVIIQAREPRYVAPTQLDRIGRVWVPVFINGRGPFRLVLDSGATHSAITPSVVQQLGLSTTEQPAVMMRGVTGSAITPAVRVDSLSVGDLEVGTSILPVVADAFGGADGLLGSEGMSDKRIYIDFRHDFVNKSFNALTVAGIRQHVFATVSIQMKFLFSFLDVLFLRLPHLKKRREILSLAFPVDVKRVVSLFKGRLELFVPPG